MVRPQGKVSFSDDGIRIIAVELYLVRSPNGFEVVDSDVSSWDHLSQLANDRPQDLLVAHYESTVALRGYWFPMWVSGDRYVVLDGLPNGPIVPGQSARDRPRWTFASTGCASRRAAP